MWPEKKAQEFAELKQGDMSVAEYEVKLTEFSRVAPHIVSHEPDSASIFVVANPVPKFLSSPSKDLGRLRLRRESFFLFPFDQNFPASLSGTAFTFELDWFALLDSSCKADKVGTLVCTCSVGIMHGLPSSMIRCPLGGRATHRHWTRSFLTCLDPGERLLNEVD